MNELDSAIQKIQNEIDRQLDKCQKCRRCKVRNATVHKRALCDMELCNECFEEYLGRAKKKPGLKRG